MFLRLLLLFTLIPLIELALLIKLGQVIGLWNTITLVILTGFAGAALARAEGFGVLRRIQEELARGQLPGTSLLDGVLILAGALLLLTPGLLTDLVGFALLIPVSRTIFRNFLQKYFSHKINRSELHVNYRVEED